MSLLILRRVFHNEVAVVVTALPVTLRLAPRYMMKQETTGTNQLDGVMTARKSTSDGRQLSQMYPWNGQEVAVVFPRSTV